MHQLIKAKGNKPIIIFIQDYPNSYFDNPNYLDKLQYAQNILKQPLYWLCICILREPYDNCYYS